MLGNVRSNARQSRNVITGEVWEAINDSWLQISEMLARPVGEQRVGDVLAAVRRAGTLVHGAVIGTMLRDESFHFARAGTFIERSDSIARILDMKYYLLLPSLSYVGSSLDTGQWDTVLRAVSGDRSYRWLNAGQIDARGIVEFLVLDERFPRSLSYCIPHCAKISPPWRGCAAEGRATADAPRRHHAGEPIKTIFDQGLRVPAPVHGVERRDRRRHLRRLQVPVLMRLSIRHTTRYRFSEPVVHALQRLRLRPRKPRGGKSSWDMEYDNAGTHLRGSTSQHGDAGFGKRGIGGHHHLPGRGRTSDHAGVIGQHAGHLPLWSFQSQSDLTRPGAKMRALANEVSARDLSPLDMLHALSAEVLDRVEYRIGSTDVSTRAEESLGAGAGVCQDHAHIFIGTARLLDIPARYVSGYLMMDDRVEQDATHGWTEANVEGLGWVGFDISNGISPDQRYVRVATGRDYRDAAPVTGISFGTASQELEVEVAVEQRQVQQ